MTFDLNQYSEHTALQDLATQFRQGSVLVYPTDTIYGLGGRADDRDVIDRVFRIKARDRSKPLSVVVANMDMLSTATDPSDSHHAFLARLFPAKVTVILPKTNYLPDELVHNEPENGLAVRIPDDLFLRRLVDKISVPLISTSANPSGEKPPHTWDELQQTWGGFSENPDGLVYREDQVSPQPSTIIDLRDNVPVIIREGSVPAAELYRLWDSVE